MTFDVVADARVEEGAPDTNFGDVDQAACDQRLAEVRDATSSSRSPGITGTVQSAKLHVWDWNDATNNGPAVYQARQLLDRDRHHLEQPPGSHRWPVRQQGGDRRVETWVEYDVVPLVPGNGDVTFVLVGDSTDGANFASKEFNDPSKKAKLEVTFGALARFPSTSITLDTPPVRRKPPSFSSRPCISWFSASRTAVERT